VTEWAAVKAGDEKARNSMIERHGYLVPLTLKKRVCRAPQRFTEDLLGAGYVALVQAVDEYDRERGVAFRTYAIRRIWGAMLEWLRKEDWVPRSVRTAQKQGEPVMILEQVSMESISYHDGESADLLLMEQLSDWEDTPEVIVPRRLHAQAVRWLVTCLPQKDRQVIEGRFWEELTYLRLSRQLSLSPARVGQIEERALHLLRVVMERSGVAAG